MIFFITNSGFSKFIKWIPLTYVSTEITKFFFLSKKTSSFKFRELLFSFANIEKYFLNERSIKSGETDPKFHAEIKKRSIPVTGKKGSVLIFDPLCLHYSDNNNSEDLRDLFLVTYNRAKDGDNYEVSNIDKQNAIKHHKEFIDDQ